MLEGKELGKAVKKAIELKGVSQAVIAKEFGITQPSVSEWTKLGRVAKKHIPHLVAYFSDVVGPEHWGLPGSWELSPRAMEAGRMLDAIKDEKRQARLYAIWEQVQRLVDRGLVVNISVGDSPAAQRTTPAAAPPTPKRRRGS